jgi:hypothetical protein
VGQVIEFTLPAFGGQAATFATAEAVKQPNLFILLQHHQKGGISCTVDMLVCSVRIEVGKLEISNTLST